MAAKLLAVILITLFLVSIASSEGKFGPGSLRSNQCPNECTRRCSKTQYHKPCMFFCQKCCQKCLCVPPGFYGNKQVCACYNNWKTKRGGPKCP
ncbi:Gibberellin-regulated protein 4 [Acorus calamus]|uniref:Gibberellin-regulated protein 4 n=1 Tax=Acorus calamus TaxID=4465 RepID=A0AAV9F0B2_ACOCL|nr:Gibberellin-regulated protein 4 [Acorus calamus]